MGICILAVEFNGLVSKQSRAIPRLAHLLLKWFICNMITYK